jgi:hypothetical protein
MASCVLAITSALVFLPDAPAGAMGPCAAKCDKAYEDDAIKCGKINDKDQKAKCDLEAYYRNKKCVKGCGDDTEGQGLKQCKEDCEYQHGRDDEACKRLKDPGERAECYSRANDKAATCRRNCEKKYKRGEE